MYHLKGLLLASWWDPQHFFQLLEGCIILDISKSKSSVESSFSWFMEVVYSSLLALHKEVYCLLK